jgi:hypothetical protein
LSQKSPFLLRERNPDVLTSIANLSNDEVFTPPTFANQMLDTVAKAWADSNDGANIWADKNVRFLDPFTKSGVFLREIVRRLSEGLEKEIPDLQERINHIVSKQVFGMAITQLTALTTRRSVYCSKRANGKHSIATIFNDEEGSIWFKRTEHTWAGGAQKVITVDENGKEIEKKLGGKCKHCGASQSEYERDKTLESHAYAFIHTEDPKQLINEVFGEEMQFDVIIGNPPYQLSTGGGTQTKQARPLYQTFVEQAKKLEPRLVVMVIPSRWFSGGMGLDSFRDSMMNDQSLRYLVDYPDSREVFGENGPAGGVSYFALDSSYKGPCEFSTVISGEVVSTKARFLNQFKTVIRNNDAIGIVEKVKKRSPSFFSEIVSPVSPFGLSTAIRGSKTKEGLKNPVILRSVAGREWIERANVPKGLEHIDKWKVLLSATASEHAGQSDKGGKRRIFSRIEVLEPGSVMTHSYLMVGPFDSELAAQRAKSYLETRFVRFLASLIQITQHISRATFDFVPHVDLSKDASDKSLYKAFNLSEEETDLIESQIKEMDTDGQ